MQHDDHEDGAIDSGAAADATVITLLAAREIDGEWRPQGCVIAIDPAAAAALVAEGAARIATPSDRAIARV